MAIIREGEATCSKCGQNTKITLYKSINVSENPELKEKVRDGSLFLWDCPHCGQVNLARYGTLYHDPALKLMVWLIPDGDVSASQMKAISNHTKAMGGYTLRLVDDMGSLMEKVLIADAGLDDAVVELCKVVVKLEMSSKMDETSRAQFLDIPFHFYRLQGEGEGRIITLTYPDGGKMTAIDIGFNVYEDCLGILERNPQIRPADGFQKIDTSWTGFIMR